MRDVDGESYNGAVAMTEAKQGIYQIWVVLV